MDSEALRKFKENMSGGKQSSKPGNRINKRKESFISSSHAPYNFVSLNKTIVEGELFEENDKYHSKEANRFTGYIKCNIETLTPLYIRGCFDENEEAKGKSEFFSPTNKARIPGSSIRGMIRTLVEIVSWSKMKFAEKEELFSFRALADKSEKLKNSYKVVRNFKTGYIIKKKDRYYIRHAKKIGGIKHFRISQNLVISAFPKLKLMNDEEYKMFREEIYFDHTSMKERNPKRPYCYWEIMGKIKKASDHPNGYGNWKKGWVICSGGIADKKEKHWIVPETDSTEIKISEDDIKAYRDACISEYIEENDFSAVNESMLPKHPCFWVEKKGKYYFGHTPYFRIPYDYKLDKFIEQETQDKPIDLTESIFGRVGDKDKETTFPGRVFFEDAICNEDSPYLNKAVSVPHILSSPKPTTFQHYLEQNYATEHKGINISGLSDYNSSNTDIRGYKLYWHKEEDNWLAILEIKEKDWKDFIQSKDVKEESFKNGKKEEGDKVLIDLNKIDINNNDDYEELLNFIFRDKKKVQHTKIRPIRSGINLNFRIRFENLSDIELGALLFVLSLPPGCAHKLGMAKPLGLGSVRITPELLISNRTERYKKLFVKSGDKFTWQISENQELDLENYTRKFEEHVLKETNGKGNKLWKVGRLKSLSTILNFAHNTKILGWNSKTSYMKLDKFKERNPLDKPLRVVKTKGTP